MIEEKENRSVLRSVRLTPTLDRYVSAISNFEDRTISKTLQRLVLQAVIDYVNKNYENPDGCFKGYLRYMDLVSDNDMPIYPINLNNSVYDPDNPDVQTSNTPD